MEKWNVRKVLSPVLVICHIFGVTINYGKRSKILCYIHQLLVFALCVWIFVHEIPSLNYWLEHSEGLHAVIVKLEAGTRWASFFSSFIFTAINNTKINKIIDDLQNNTPPLPKRVQNKIFKFHVAHILFNTITLCIYNILGHDLIWPNLNYHSYTSILYVFVDLIIFLCVFEFVQMTNLISEIFKEINLRLKEFRSKGGLRVNMEGKKVVRLRETHLFLSKTCAEINSCYTYQLLFVICYVMVQVIYAIRAVVGDFGIADVEKRSINIIVDLTWLLPFAMIIVQMIVYCERTATECRKTILVAHHLMNMYYYNEELLKELEIFVLQIRQHPIVFNVKFFDLDYPFFNTMINSMVTYLIITLTFQGETDSGMIKDWNFRPPSTAGPQEAQTTESA